MPRVWVRGSERPCSPLPASMQATKVNALVEFLEAPKALSNVDLAAKA